ncbi:MAG: hypothetical protein ACOCP8_02630 [archaeon]
MNKKEREESEESCEVCGNNIIIKDYQKNQKICNNCGNIIEEGIKELGEEYYPVGFEDHNPNLGGTKIDNIFKHANTPQEAQKGYNLKKTNKINIPSEQKHKREIKTQIKRAASQLNLPHKIVKEVTELSIKAKKEGYAKGKSKEDVVIAMVWLISKKKNYPLLYSEMMDKFYGIPEESSKRTERDRKKIKDVKKLANDLNSKLNINSSFIHPIYYINRIRDAVDMPKRIILKAKKFLKYYWKRGEFTGRISSGVAGAVLLVLAKKEEIDVKNKEISNHSGVTSVTIRKIAKKIEKLMEENDEWKEESVYED